jgi:hypothetical protein
MTRKILLISDDKQFMDNLFITALTLTKLNHQITFTEDISDKHTDFILIDLDTSAGADGFESKIKMIKEFRGSSEYSNKKILAVYSDEITGLKAKVFGAGCDSVMTKNEFRAVANNILII